MKKEVIDITNKIFIIRDQKVILDKDLAQLYGVEVKRINEQVKRNISRFPEDFCFQLNDKELARAKSQIATLNNPSSRNYKKPYVFTEQGAYALSFVLRSEKAVQTGIFIARAFTHLRRFILKNENLLMELKNNEQLSSVFRNFENRIEKDLVVLYKNNSDVKNRIKKLEEELKEIKKLI